MDDSRLKGTKLVSVRSSLRVGPRSPQLTERTRPSPPQDAGEPDVDRFSKLPNELLHRIFSLAYARSTPTEPLSRRLRPFYDALKFIKIAARGSRIRSLYEAVTARPAFGSAVREARLVNRASDTQLGTSEVQTLFELLPNLKIVDISGSDSAPWLEAVFPTRDGAETALRPSVKVLCVESSDAHGAGYDAKVLAALKQLPNLEDGQLHLPGSSADQADSSMVDLSLPGVDRLHLDLHGNGAAVGDFVACFPRLRSLSLRACEATCDFSPALAGIKSYKDLRSICLRGHAPLGWQFPKELAKFAALEVLGLDGDFAHVGPEAYGALQYVPITTLYISTGSDVSAAGLETLLGPRGSCPTLRFLRLDNLSADYPPDLGRAEIEDEEFNLYEFADSSYEAASILSRFKLPRWTTQFSRSAYDRLARAAKSHGVVVKGSTVAACRIDRHYEELFGVVDEWREVEAVQMDEEDDDFELEDTEERWPIIL
jgi:hypothetical protein